MAPDPATPIKLPAPDLEGGARLENTIARRRSMRDFEPGGVTPAELGQLLWVAQGVSDPAGLRTVPSAGALYPLELCAIVKASGGLQDGIYRYFPLNHAVALMRQGDFRTDFARTALGQEWTARAGVILVVAADYSRTTSKYGERGRRYVAIEAGHCVQNVYLQALALGLAATEVGAFGDDAVGRLVELPRGEEPVTSIVVGRPAQGRRGLSKAGPLRQNRRPGNWAGK